MSERSDILLRKFREQEDVIEERLHHTIENDRKTKAVFQIVDGAGKPVSGAKVRVNLCDHDFKYGANIFMLDEFECERKIRFTATRSTTFSTLQRCRFTGAILNPSRENRASRRIRRKSTAVPHPTCAWNTARKSGSPRRRTA